MEKKYDVYIEGNSLRCVWTEYVRHVSSGTEGHDDNLPIREQFWVKLCFAPGTDFADLHPAMDRAQQAQYVRKVLTTELDPQLGGSYGYRLRCSYGVDQIEALVNKLATKPESKK